MKVRCAKADLNRGLSMASRAISLRSTLPVLKNVLIEVEPDLLRLSATDLEIGVQCTVPAQIEEDGAIAAPAAVLGDFVSSLPEQEIIIETDGEHIRLDCGKANCRVNGSAAEEYPVLPEVGPDCLIELPQAKLRQIIKQVAFAASREETRAMLTGVLFDIHGERMNVVATDTHRLACSRVVLESDFGESRAVIVPASTMNHLGHLLTDDDDPVEVRLTDNQVQFNTRSGSMRLVSRIIDGQFPSYEKVIPVDADRRITVTLSTLEDAVRRASTVARADANKVTLDCSEALMTITAETAEVGRAHDELSVELIGDPVQVAFNAQYILDVLNVIDSDQVIMELTGPLNPGVLRPEDDESYIYVLMPMQLV